MTHQPTEDDTRALRRDGDFSDYLRSLIRPTRTSTTPRDGPSTATYGHHHTPGAWPHGTHPQTSATCRPDCGCALHPPPTQTTT
jgi:hypothetical protein